MSGKKKHNFYRPEIQDLLIAAFAVVVLLLNLRMVGKCYNPFVFNDEAGYWTHAYTMAGYDWRGMSSTLAWYSYGYSFMLVPLIKLIHDPVTLYRAALVLNAVFVTLTYLMFVYILRFLFPKLKKAEAGFAAAAAALYTSYQHNSGIAFSETALLLVTTLAVFVLVRVMKRPTYLNLACFGAVCAYLFMIHNRTIGIGASAVLVVILCVFFKKTDLRHAAVFLGVFLAGMVADHIIHHQLEIYLWVSGKAGGGNDSGSIMTKIKASVSSVDGLKKLLSIMASQAFSAFAGTFCIALFALWAIFRRLLGTLTECIKAVKKKKKRQFSRLVDEKLFVLLFIFCAFIATWLISSIFMTEFQRVDHIIYNRYYDITVGLLIMTGICFMLEADKKDFMFVLTMPVIMLAGASRAAVLMNGVATHIFSRVCAPAVSWYYDKYGENFYAYAVFAAAVFGIILLAELCIKKKNISLCAVSVIIAVMFTSFMPAARVVIFNNQRAYKGDREMFRRIRETEGAEFYVTPDTGAFISFVQYMIPDKKISFAYNPDELGENAYIIADKKEIVNMRDREVADSSDRHIVYRNVIKAEHDQVEIPLSYMNLFNPSCYIADEDVIQSDPNSNYLCFGPYLELDEGEYTFSLDMDMESNMSSAEPIGFVEVRSDSGTNVLDHADITDSIINSSGKAEIEMKADVEEQVSDIEIVVFLYSPDSVKAQLNSIKVNTEED